MSAKLPRINNEREQTAANILSHCRSSQLLRTADILGTPRNEADEGFKSYNLGRGEGFEGSL